MIKIHLNPSEAEYAYQLRKKIIPLMMERRFQPRGWLGIIMGTKLWMDFREDGNLEAGTSQLIKELGQTVTSQGRCGGVRPQVFLEGGHIKFLCLNERYE